MHAGLGVAGQSWTAGSRSQSALETPTVIPQVLWLAGLAVFLATGALLFVQALAAAASGRAAEAVKLVGTRSADLGCAVTSFLLIAGDIDK